MIRRLGCEVGNGFDTGAFSMSAIWTYVSVAVWMVPLG